MTVEGLKNYISEARAAGQSDNAIRAALLEAGWQQIDIDTALEAPAPPPAQPNTHATAGEFEAPHRSSAGRYRSVGIALMVAGVVLLLGGGIWAYVAFVDPDPKDVLREMIEALDDVDSAAYTFSIDVVGPDPDATPPGAPVGLPGAETSSPFFGPTATPTEPLHVRVTAEGQIDARDTQNIQAQSRLNLLVENSGLFDFSAVLDSLVVGDTFYFRLFRAPTILFFDLSHLEGAWFYVTADEAKQEVVDEGVETELTEEQEERIKELIMGFSYIKEIVEVGEEEIEGVNTFHYQIYFDKEEWERVGTEIERIVRPDDEDVAGAEGRYAVFSAEEMNIEPLELWVGTRDRLPYRLRVSGSSLSVDGKAARVAIEGTASDYNQEFDFTPPTGARSLEEVLQGLFEGPTELETSGSVPLLHQQTMLRNVLTRGFLYPVGTAAHVLTPRVETRSGGSLFSGLLLLLEPFQ